MIAAIQLLLIIENFYNLLHIFYLLVSSPVFYYFIIFVLDLIFRSTGRRIGRISLHVMLRRRVIKQLDHHVSTVLSTISWSSVSLGMRFIRFGASKVGTN